MNHKNKTVVRSMDILDLFIDHPALSFQEMIDLSGIPKSSVYRMIRSLEEIGFLEKGDDLKYRLGTVFLKFGHLVSTRIDIRQIAVPIMEKLHKEVKEAINLAIREGDEAVYIEKIDKFQSVRLYTAIGKRSPLYAGACPRAILSFLTDEELSDYFRRVERHPIAMKTIVQENQLRTSIQEARLHGFTVSHSELENYTAAVGAPIFDYRGQVIGGLSIAGIEAHFEGEIVEKYSEKVKEAALKISKEIGFDARRLD